MRSTAFDREGPRNVLRGSICAETLQYLQSAYYQREILPLAARADLIRAYENGEMVPDIELGMRGNTFEIEGDVVVLQDPVYIIDGLQRTNAALHLLSTSDVVPYLGATVHLDTNEDWERRRFRILNMNRYKLSPNVLARNLAQDIRAIEVLRDLSREEGFALARKVSWTQRQNRDELITAMTFLKVIGNLHSHLGPGRSVHLEELSNGLQQIMEQLGEEVFLENVKAFFELVDQCWGVQRVAFKEGAVYMRTSFLQTLARVISQHLDFWRGNRLFIKQPLTRKIKGFPITDPSVAQLASSGGKANPMLYQLMVTHINSGKRSRHLKSREAVPVVPAENG